MLETNFQSDENNFIVCYFFLWLLIKFLPIRIWRSDLKNNLKWVIVIREFYCYEMERVSANFQLEWALNGLSNISPCPKCRDKENFYNHVFVHLYMTWIPIAYSMWIYRENCFRFQQQFSSSMYEIDNGILSRMSVVYAIKMYCCNW